MGHGSAGMGQKAVTKNSSLLHSNRESRSWGPHYLRQRCVRLGAYVNRRLGRARNLEVNAFCHCLR